MKYRRDFVTNSSSSSFVCEICGKRDVGWDGPGDVGMVECINGHVFCLEHLLEGEYENEREITEQMCPICQFVDYSEYDLSAYLEKKYGISREEVFENVKRLNKRRKRLYENEYILYVCTKYNLNPAEIVSSWKSEFGTYKRFKKFLSK